MVLELVDEDLRSFDSCRITNQEYTLWHRQDQLVLSWLLLSISEGVLAQVIGCSTSSEVWITLEKLFASQSKTRILQLHIQLQSIKKNSLTMGEYFAKIKRVADNLAAAGQPISNDDKIMYLLAGLGSNYDPVVASVTSKPDSFSLQEIQAILLNQEARLEQLHSEKSIEFQQTTANIASQTFFKGNDPKVSIGGHTTIPRNIRGGYRGGRNRGGRGSRYNFSKPICQVCGKPGHTITCYYRFDHN